jgi:type II secretory pathway predicted ATPase ExeA
MRRPSNLMKSLTAPQAALAPTDPGPPSNYLDLYGLSKAPFDAAPDGAGYILFGSRRRAFELLIDHMMNGSGLVLLNGEGGIGKTETLRAAASVASGSDLHTVLITRPPEGRIAVEQIVSALDGQPESFFAQPRMALLADDVELMPNDCIGMLRSFAQPKDGVGGSALILSSSGTELSRPDLAELAGVARNTIRLQRLGPGEVRQYIERSLWMAGGTTRRLITPDAMKLIVVRSGGVPAAINRLMEAAFTAGFARGDTIITARTVVSVTGPAAPRTRPRVHPSEPSSLLARLVPPAALGLLVVGASVFLYEALTDKPAPKPPVVVQRPVEPPPPAKPAETLPPSLVTALTRRGSEALDLGDTASARLLFQRAAEAGSSAAAIALGKTYDPSFTVNVAARDPNRAAEWYRKAAALGDPAAADLLKRLGAR